jgi:hypothetical protein
MEFIQACLATAFIVGILDGLPITWWPRVRPLGAVVSAALFAPWNVGFVRAIIYLLAASFVGLALPALLDSVLSRPVKLTRDRPRL